MALYNEQIIFSDCNLQFEQFTTIVDTHNLILGALAVPKIESSTDKPIPTFQSRRDAFVSKFKIIVDSHILTFDLGEVTPMEFLREAQEIGQKELNSTPIMPSHFSKLEQLVKESLDRKETMADLDNPMRKMAYDLKLSPGSKLEVAHSSYLATIDDGGEGYPFSRFYKGYGISRVDGEYRDWQVISMAQLIVAHVANYMATGKDYFQGKQADCDRDWKSLSFHSSNTSSSNVVHKESGLCWGGMGLRA